MYIIKFRHFENSNNLDILAALVGKGNISHPDGVLLEDTALSKGRGDLLKKVTYQWSPMQHMG